MKCGFRNAAFQAAGVEVAFVLATAPRKSKPAGRMPAFLKYARGEIRER
jgi:hypothetical protein